MRVFVTGATGFIGSAIVNELIGAGHSVLGLYRSEEKARRLAALGAEPFRGDLADLDALGKGAGSCDGVIHTAFIHDFSKFVENCETDRRVIAALGDALAGTDKPLVVTSGTALLARDGELAMETAEPTPSIPRVASEQAAEAAAARGVRVSVVRLPPSVHDLGDKGFVPMLAGLAREKGRSAYVRDGLNHWPAVHRLDAARLYRLALEAGEKGARYHGNAEEGIAFREIANAIGRQLDLPVVGLSPEEAADHFGWFQHFVMLDNPTSNAWTRQRLDWQPKQPGLLADIDRRTYFV